MNNFNIYITVKERLVTAAVYILPQVHEQDENSCSWRKVPKDTEI